jgi:hypothetical protein
VARWFADPESRMSELLALTKPRARGFVFELPQVRSRILWHHSWVRAFGGAGSLAYHAHDHPLIGSDGAWPLHWSLCTQQEVITEPCELPRPVRLEETTGATLMEMEQRLLPPWLRSKE